MVSAPLVETMVKLAPACIVIVKVPVIGLKGVILTAELAVIPGTEITTLVVPLNAATPDTFEAGPLATEDVFRTMADSPLTKLFGVGVGTFGSLNVAFAPK